MSENWRPIPGFEGVYEVSDLGNVRSLDRVVHYEGARGRSGYSRLTKGRVLRPGRSKSGHLTVVLGQTHGSKTVHSLVMLAFVGPPGAGQEVRHLNGDPADNQLVNLQYGTRSENNEDASKHGTRGKLSEEDVRFARRAYTSGRATAVELAGRFGVQVASMCKAIAGRSYKWVK